MRLSTRAGQERFALFKRKFGFVQSNQYRAALAANLLNCFPSA
jgi:hypothetical protein